MSLDLQHFYFVLLLSTLCYEIVKYKNCLSIIVWLFLKAFFVFRNNFFWIIYHSLNALNFFLISFVPKVNFFTMVFTAANHFGNVLFLLLSVLPFLDRLLFIFHLIKLYDPIPAVTCSFINCFLLLRLEDIEITLL